MRLRSLVTSSAGPRQGLIVAGAALGIFACSAGGTENQALLPGQQQPQGTGGTAGTGGATSDPLTPPGAGEAPGFDLGGDLGEPVQAPGCQQAQREFAPKISTVFMLVDRSGTMFDPIAGTNNVSPWGALRGGALQVMRELESSVRFGFGAFVGAELSAQACDFDFQSVEPELGNYDAIASLYEPLDKPGNQALDETPALLALAAAGDQLRADSQDGDKYILFVTDGEPDYCDNGAAACPADSVISMLQRLASPEDALGQPQVPVKTLVLGLTSPMGTIRPEVLQGFANAGAGAPVAPLTVNPGQPYRPEDLFYTCNQRLGWAADLLAAGKPSTPGQSVATYAADPTLGGTAPVFQPDPTDQAALIEQLRAALAGVKSCTFDLAEDGVKVDLLREDLGVRAHVIVNGNPVPLDLANGWHMLTDTTVQLEGEACSAWRNPTVETTISFDFPCEIFVPQ
jgi:hypothetical protein